MTEDHDNIRELLAAHALDALEPDEARAVDAHVAICDPCRTELDQHRAVASLIGAQSVEADVPDSLWGRVEAGIATAAVTPLRPNRTGLITAIGAAAAMLALVVVQTARLDTAQDQLAAAEERIAGIDHAIAAGDWTMVASLAATTPGARSISLDGDAPTEVTLLPNGTGFVTASQLDVLPPGRTYQLWIVQRGEVVSAGLLGNGATGSVFRYDPSSLEGLVVTEEEAAGVVVSDGPAVAAWFDA